MGAAADLAMALDRVVFTREALGLEPDGWQARVLRWSGGRLLMNCCRQSGKSTTAAVLALHEVLYRPGCLVLLLSPSMRQSSELFRKVTNLLSRLETRPTLTEDNRLSLILQSGSRVVSLPSSEATVRFSGASLIIEDTGDLHAVDHGAALRFELGLLEGTGHGAERRLFGGTAVYPGQLLQRRSVLRGRGNAALVGTVSFVAGAAAVGVGHSGTAEQRHHDHRS